MIVVPLNKLPWRTRLGIWWTGGVQADCEHFAMDSRSESLVSVVMRNPGPHSYCTGYAKLRNCRLTRKLTELIPVYGEVSYCHRHGRDLVIGFDSAHGDWWDVSPREAIEEAVAMARLARLAEKYVVTHGVNPEAVERLMAAQVQDVRAEVAIERFDDILEWRRDATFA